MTVTNTTLKEIGLKMDTQYKVSETYCKLDKNTHVENNYLSKNIHVCARMCIVVTTI